MLYASQPVELQFFNVKYAFLYTLVSSKEAENRFSDWIKLSLMQCISFIIYCSAHKRSCLRRVARGYFKDKLVSETRKFVLKTNILNAKHPKKLSDVLLWAMVRSTCSTDKHARQCKINFFRHFDLENSVLLRIWLADFIAKNQYNQSRLRSMSFKAFTVHLKSHY